MALETSLLELIVCLERLRDTVTATRITVEEDGPCRDEAFIAAKLEDMVEDVFGSVEEAIKHGMNARMAVGREPRLLETRRSLAKSQAAFRTTAQNYFSTLVSYAWLKDFAEFGRSRGGACQAWTESVMNGLEECRRPLDEASSALDRCWEDLAEALGGPVTREPAPDIGDPR